LEYEFVIFTFEAVTIEAMDVWNTTGKDGVLMIPRVSLFVAPIGRLMGLLERLDEPLHVLLHILRVWWWSL
jgi:hypothetical protein